MPGLQVVPVVPNNTFTYDGLETTVDLLRDFDGPVHDTWTYTLDALGRVTEALDPEGYTTAYEYDADSNLTELSLPIDTGPPVVDQTISYTYDARGNVLSQSTQLTDSTSVATLMSYNATNDLVTRSEADNDSDLKLVTLYVYDGSGHLTGVTENCTSSGTIPPGDASTCTGAGTQNASTNIVSSYTYTADDELETETDPLGRVTKHAYDTHGNEISLVANFVDQGAQTADQNVETTFTYTTAGLLASSTDPVGATTSYTYDALGRQLTEALPGDASIEALTRTMTYDSYGNVLTEADSWTGTTRTTTYVYDNRNRQIEVTDPAGVESSTTYDEAGNVIETTSGGVTTAQDFDGLGRAIELSVASSTSVMSFDGRGLTVAASDPTDVTNTATYDIGGRPMSEILAPEGAELETTYTYDLLGRETSSTTPDGIVTTTTYDRLGRVVSTTVAGATTSYAYDHAGNQVSTTDPDSVVTTTQYDALNRVTVVVANDVATPTLPTEDVTTTTWYDAAGRTVAFTDNEGISSRSIYNMRGLVVTSIANCVEQGAAPDECTGGTADATTNITTVTEYDGSGAAIGVATAVGTSAEASYDYAYDIAGRRQALRDARGTVTRTLYDSDGRVITTIVNCTEDTSSPAPPTGSWWDCDGSTLDDGTWNVTTSRTYDSHGNVATETAPNGRVTTYVYDAADRLVERIDNDVAGTPLDDEDLSTFYAYDDAGRQSAVRAPTVDRDTFAVTAYLYDEDGHLEAEIRNCVDAEAWAECAGGGTIDAQTNLVTRYEYDTRGNRVALVAADPSATSGTSTATVTTRYAFDDQNRLCGVLENATVALASPNPCVDPGSSSTTANVWTTYTYNALGNMVTMTDGRGSTTDYGYDASGRMSTITDALGNSTTYEYDALGRRISQSERGTGTMPTLVAWTYDAAGRVHQRITDADTTTYSYDVAGSRTQASSSTSTISTTYDRLNRPLTVSVTGDTAATTSYTYDLTSPTWTDPSGSYSATLDAFDRQVTLTDPVHGSTSFDWTYRADGQPSSISAPNGNTTTYGYDDAGMVSAKVTANSGGTPADYGWTRNRAGQILTEASTITGDPSNGSTAYAYDQLSRLTSFTRVSSTTAYGWQEVPNRESVQVDAADPDTYTFDAANRETTSSLGDFEYDDEGRLVVRPGQDLAWNDLGQLIAVTDSPIPAVIGTYAYDAFDRLLTVDHGGSDVVRFRYVGLTTQVAQIVDDATEDVLHNVANDWSGERLFEWDGSTETFYGTNGHHDLTWTASDTGGVSATLRYDPWGNLTASSGSHLPAFRFQGSWFDPDVELSWVIARWYAPSLGRFISEDSLLGQPSAPPSRHLYSYAEGEPVTRWDPAGLAWYRPEPGESLLTISRKFGVAYNTLTARNPRLIGQRLDRGSCVDVPLPRRTYNWCYRPGRVNFLVKEFVIPSHVVRLPAPFGMWAKAWATMRIRVLTDVGPSAQPSFNAILSGNGSLVQFGGTAFNFNWMKGTMVGMWSTTPLYCINQDSVRPVPAGRDLPCASRATMDTRAWMYFNPGIVAHGEVIYTASWRVDGRGWAPPARLEFRTTAEIEVGYEPWVYAIPVAVAAAVILAVAAPAILPAAPAFAPLLL